MKKEKILFSLTQLSFQEGEGCLEFKVKCGRRRGVMGWGWVKCYSVIQEICDHEYQFHLYNFLQIDLRNDSRSYIDTVSY